MSATDSGSSNADGITNISAATVYGSVAGGNEGEANATVHVRIGAVEVDTTVADSSGNWSYTFDGDLAIFAGDGWGFNPSLLLFLFLDDDGPPEGQEIVVTPDGDGTGSSPHVHYRWRDEASGELDVDAVTDGFELRLRFGEVENGLLPGTIAFAVPGEDTRIEGAFRASVED